MSDPQHTPGPFLPEGEDLRATREELRDAVDTITRMIGFARRIDDGDVAIVVTKEQAADIYRAVDHHAVLAVSAHRRSELDATLESIADAFRAQPSNASPARKAA